jgi:8-oxo-dGTP diphosphatase
VFLVRHASAGERTEWEGDDRLRPLDEKGRKQAADLVALLNEFAIDRILSSPAVRCVQTVEPLARSRGVEIEQLEQLSEDWQWNAGATLVHELASEDAVVCGHGGLEQAALDDPPRWKKGAVFVLDDALRIVETLRP